jgi:hypothetical protein
MRRRTKEISGFLGRCEEEKTCVAPTVLGTLFRHLPQPSRAGLTCDAPTALAKGSEALKLGEPVHEMSLLGATVGDGIGVEA